MSWLRPKLEDLPREFPVFPLAGAVLLPRGKLPLNIFEPRYLAMVEDSLASGRMFGMVQPNNQLPAASEGPALYPVGCLARISSFSETDDGRFLITLNGLMRFSIRRELPMRHGYRQVAVDLNGFAEDLEPPGRIGVSREELLAALRGYFRAHGLEANWEAIEQLNDAALVVTLAMICPFEPVEKQAVLEAPIGERAALLLALLRMGRHEDGEARLRPS